MEAKKNLRRPDPSYRTYLLK